MGCSVSSLTCGVTSQCVRERGSGNHSPIARVDPDACARDLCSSALEQELVREQHPPRVAHRERDLALRDDRDLEGLARQLARSLCRDGAAQQRLHVPVGFTGDVQQVSALGEGHAHRPADHREVTRDLRQVHDLATAMALALLVAPLPWNQAQRRPPVIQEVDGVFASSGRVRGARLVNVCQDSEVPLGVIDALGGGEGRLKNDRSLARRTGLASVLSDGKRGP